MCVSVCVCVSLSVCVQCVSMCVCAVCVCVCVCVCGAGVCVWGGGKGSESGSELLSVKVCDFLSMSYKHSMKFLQSIHHGTSHTYVIILALCIIIFVLCIITCGSCIINLVFFYSIADFVCTLSCPFSPLSEKKG